MIVVLMLWISAVSGIAYVLSDFNGRWPRN